MNKKLNLNDLKSRKLKLEKKISLLKKQVLKNEELTSNVIELDHIKDQIFFTKNCPKILEKKQNRNRVINFCLFDKIIIYKEVFIRHYESKITCIEYNNNEIDQAFALTDILSFIFLRSFFINENFNDKEYAYFQDMSNFYFYNNINFWNETKLESLKDKTFIAKLKYPELLSLYHSAQKQIDPFAKCIFLYRIIEYDYNNIKKFSKNRNKKDGNNNDKNKYMKNIIKKSLLHKFFPLYYRINIFDKYNLITKWKIKARCYFKKNSAEGLYELIYKTGRCGIAHGNHKNKIMYHTKENYKLVEYINVFLELISRYIIETEETDLLKALK